MKMSRAVDRSVATEDRTPAQRAAGTITALARPSRLARAFEYRRDALAAANTHRHQRIAAADALQLVQRLDRDDGAGGADRMSERNTAAVRIHLGRIRPEIFHHRTRLRGERLVRFNHVHILD